MAKGKGQTMIYKTLHRKLNIEQQNPTKKTNVNWGAPEGLAVPDPIVTRYTFINSNKYPDASYINEASQYYNLLK